MLTFTSPTQGTVLQIGRDGAISNTPTPPQNFELKGTFSGASWIPAYCGGELTVTYTNPPVPGPVTATYAYTSSQSGTVLTLTNIAGTYSGGLTDGFVQTNVIRLEQQ